MTAAKGQEWVRLSTSFHGHPKALQVGAVGRDLFLALVCASFRFDRDGDVPIVLALAVAGGLGVEDPIAVLDSLVQAGLLDVEADGSVWLIHDYADMQETRKTREASRVAARDRKARWKERQNASRTRSERVGNSVETETETEGETEVLITDR